MAEFGLDECNHYDRFSIEGYAIGCMRTIFFTVVGKGSSSYLYLTIWYSCGRVDLNNCITCVTVSSNSFILQCGVPLFKVVQCFLLEFFWVDIRRKLAPVRCIVCLFSKNGCWLRAHIVGKKLSQAFIMLMNVIISTTCTGMC